MLQNLEQFYGKKIGAVDGHIGHVKDFYFDDRTWHVRYLVADTGSWLPTRQVLLPPRVFSAHAFEKAENADNEIIHVKLTRRQIEQSPFIAPNRPVTRQYEEAYHRFYSWPFYWMVDGKDDSRLRSTQSVTGYQVESTDGKAGVVSGFMIHGSDWTIREILVQGGHEFGEEPISLIPENIGRISLEESTVFLTISLADIRQVVGSAGTRT